MGRLRVMCAVILIAVFAGVGSAAAVPVGLELSLAIDVSGSVSASEYNLQMRGYALAFRDAQVQQAVLGVDNGIAVNLVFWAGRSQQVEAISFQHLNSLQAIESFASSLLAVERPFSGGTSIGPAIEFAANSLIQNDFEGARLIIDVSGDGVSIIPETEQARDQALSMGIDTINGLPIGGGDRLVQFYQNHLIGGDDAFLVAAASFDDFRQAIATKLFREIDSGPDSDQGTEVPEPTSALLLLVYIAGFGARKNACERILS